MGLNRHALGLPSFGKRETRFAPQQNKQKTGLRRKLNMIKFC